MPEKIGTASPARTGGLQIHNLKKPAPDQRALHERGYTMTMTREKIEGLLDETTPGPWTQDGPPTNKIIWSSAENRVCFMAHSNGLNDERDEANARLIAAGPDLARTALDALAEVERLRGALEKAYAAMNYMGDILNNMDAVLPEDEDATTEAFEAVRAALEGKG